MVENKFAIVILRGQGRMSVPGDFVAGCGVHTMASNLLSVSYNSLALTLTQILH